MTAQGVAHVVDVHLEKRAVAWATGGDEHVVDRRGDCFEKLLQRLRVVGIEGRGTQRADVRGRCREPVGVRPVRMTSAPSTRACRAVSSPMRALPPMRTTVCPASDGAR